MTTINQYGYQLIGRRLDPDCGCIEEEWDTPLGFASIHLKPDGLGECYFDSGDYGTWEVNIQASNPSEFHNKLIEYVDNVTSGSAQH